MPWSVLSQGSGQLWGEQTAESEGGSRGTGQEETAVFQGREDTVLDPTIVMEAVESGRFWRPFLKTFKKKFFFLSFFLAVLGLHCSFSPCDEQELFSVAVRGFLIAVASLAAEHKL